MAEEVKTTEKLPDWDLTDLYPSIHSKEFEKDLKTAGMLAEKFSTRYQGKLEGLSGDEFGQSIEDYEKYVGVMGKMGFYTNLLKATNLNNEEVLNFCQNFSEKAKDISNKTLFYGLEINSLSDENIAEKMKSPKVAKYAPWLEKNRAFKDHDLPEELERLDRDRDITGRSTLLRIYEETKNGFRFEIDGNKYTESQLSPFFDSPDPEVRKKAGDAMGVVYGEERNRKLMATITNALAKDKEVSDKWNKFEKPYSARNLANQVEDEVVDALVSSVKKNYADTTHRFYDLKAKWLGVDKINYWDRNAPLPEVPEKKYTWEESKKIVLEAFGEFSPKMAEIGKQFFDNNWIDVPPKDGKRSGAFASGGVKSSHPYLLLNFQGRSGDVKTLAHELGHGIHQCLAKEQGDLMSGTPLTLAETASVFGEMLVFKHMLKKETDPKVRFAMIAEKTNNMINTATRQIAFHNYETDVHNERRTKGEIPAKRLDEIWTTNMKECLGSSVEMPESSKCIWGHVPHMMRTPFYVYAYSFGNNLVTSLYQTYEEGKVDNFQEKYLKMLSKGGTEGHKKLLAPFGLDASKPDFWDKGMKVISGFVDELEKLTKELGMDKTKNQPVKNDVIVKNAKQNKR